MKVCMCLPPQANDRNALLQGDLRVKVLNHTYLPFRCSSVVLAQFEQQNITKPTIPIFSLFQFSSPTSILVIIIHLIRFNLVFNCCPNSQNIGFLSIYGQICMLLIPIERLLAISISLHVNHFKNPCEFFHFLIFNFFLTYRILYRKKHFINLNLCLSRGLSFISIFFLAKIHHESLDYQFPFEKFFFSF